MKTYTLLSSAAPDTSSATSCVTSSATPCAASFTGSSLRRVLHVLVPHVLVLHVSPKGKRGVGSATDR